MSAGHLSQAIFSQQGERYSVANSLMSRNTNVEHNLTSVMMNNAVLNATMIQELNQRDRIRRHKNTVTTRDHKYFEEFSSSGYGTGQSKENSSFDYYSYAPSLSDTCHPDPPILNETEICVPDSTTTLHEEDPYLPAMHTNSARTTGDYSEFSITKYSSTLMLKEDSESKIDNEFYETFTSASVEQLPRRKSLILDTDNSSIIHDVSLSDYENPRFLPGNRWNNLKIRKSNKGLVKKPSLGKRFLSCFSGAAENDSSSIDPYQTTMLDPDRTSYSQHHQTKSRSSSLGSFTRNFYKGFVDSFRKNPIAGTNKKEAIPWPSRRRYCRALEKENEKL
ncbi:hypothetical protein Ciccas_006300 [Cichlidogyrus casuarinus]|uniref:Uncharacterized protein n=1 Tax=Cichlidogyrus casuarinus TaxID=1844966 RepID=A0ABD2Q682_9PLAT